MKRLFTIGAIVLFGHIAGVSPANAGDNTTPAAETPQGKSISEYLTPDGRIDLEAARRAGYEGSLDLDGFDVTFDPADGSPRLIRSGDE